MENEDDYVKITGKEMLQINIDALTKEKENFKNFNMTILERIEVLRTSLKSCDTLNKKADLLESATRLKIELERNPVSEKTIHKRVGVITKEFKSDNIFGDVMPCIHGGLIKQTEDLIKSIQNIEFKIVTDTTEDFKSKYIDSELTFRVPTFIYQRQKDALEGLLKTNYTNEKIVWLKTLDLLVIGVCNWIEHGIIVLPEGDSKLKFILRSFTKSSKAINEKSLRNSFSNTGSQT